MIRPRFDPIFNWGHIAIAVGALAGLLGAQAIRTFSPLEVPLYNKAQIEQNKQLIKHLEDSDAKQEREVREFRQQILAELTKQTELLSKVVTQNAVFNERLTNVERRLENVEKAIVPPSQRTR